MIIYLSTLLFLIFCIIVFDINGLKKYRRFNITIVLLILICISGFSYRLGGDGIIYLREYKQYGDISDISYKYLMGFQGRMPGWVLLCTVCKSIIEPYWFFKLVHAIILNTAFVITIRNNAKYVFSGLLLYYTLIYFNLNFQLLRESLAISLFFFSLPYFYSCRWWKYYFMVLLAMSFHEGAVLLLIFPIFRLLGINKISFILYALGCSLIIMKASYILEFVLNIQIDGEVQGKIATYQKGMDTDYKFNFLSNFALNVFFPLFILYYNMKKKAFADYSYLSIVSVLLYIISTVIPIGYRFLNYVLIFNYLLIVDFIINSILKCSFNKQFKLAYVSLFMCFFILLKGRMYLLNYGNTNIPSYVQYYPYASIFEEYKDPTRERLLEMVD